MNCLVGERMQLLYYRPRSGAAVASTCNIVRENLRQPCLCPCVQQASQRSHVAQSSSNSNSSWFLPRPAHSSAAASPPAEVVDDGSGAGDGGSNRKHRWRGGGNSNPWGSSSTALQWWQQLLAVLTAALLPILLPAPAQAAATTSKRSGFMSHQDDKTMSSWQLDAFVDRMWDLSGPILNNMGFSGILGACTAAALKFVGRTLAASVGIGLVLIQVLSYYNVITVNWSVVHKQARQVLDTTGDGRLDQDGFKRVVKQGLVVLSEGVPSLSGFLVGFLVGAKLF